MGKRGIFIQLSALKNKKKKIIIDKWFSVPFSFHISNNQFNQVEQCNTLLGTPFVFVAIQNQFWDKVFNLGHLLFGNFIFMSARVWKTVVRFRSQKASTVEQVWETQNERNVTKVLFYNCKEITIEAFQGEGIREFVK